MIEITGKAIDDRTGQVTVAFKELVTLSTGRQVEVEGSYVLHEGVDLTESWTNEDVEAKLREKLALTAEQVVTVPKIELEVIRERA